MPSSLLNYILILYTDNNLECKDFYLRLFFLDLGGIERGVFLENPVQFSSAEKTILTGLKLSQFQIAIGHPSQLKDGMVDSCEHFANLTFTPFMDGNVNQG